MPLCNGFKPDLRNPGLVLCLNEVYKFIIKQLFRMIIALKTGHFIQVIWIKTNLLITRTAVTAFCAFKLITAFDNWKIHNLRTADTLYKLNA